MPGLVEAVGVIGILWGQEFGKRTDGSLVRGQHTIGCRRAKRVKVNKVPDQWNVEDFANLLEVIILVDQLERLRGVIETLVGPEREIKSAVGNQSLPPVAISGESCGLGEVLIVGIGHNEREVSWVELTESAPLELAAVHRVQAAIRARRQVGARILRGGVATKSNSLHGHLGLVAVRELGAGLLDVWEITTTKESLGIVNGQLQGTGESRMCLAGLHAPRPRVTWIEVGVPAPSPSGRGKADQGVEVRRIGWEEDPWDP